MKRSKKVISLVCAALVFFLLTTFAIAAGTSINGNYKGYPIANVFINGIKLTGLDVPAIGIDGRTLLPLRALVESVSGIVDWDSKTQSAKVIKPETSIYFVILNEDGQTVKDVFSDIPILEQGQTFYSMVDISGIPQGKYTFKCEIVDSKGDFSATAEDIEGSIIENDSILSVPVEWDSIQLQAQTYKFRVYMKDSAGAYKLIATKTMKYK